MSAARSIGASITPAFGPQVSASVRSCENTVWASGPPAGRIVARRLWASKTSRPSSPTSKIQTRRHVRSSYVSSSSSASVRVSPRPLDDHGHRALDVPVPRPHVLSGCTRDEHAQEGRGPSQSSVSRCSCSSGPRGPEAPNPSCRRPTATASRCCRSVSTHWPSASTTAESEGIGDAVRLI